MKYSGVNWSSSVMTKPTETWVKTKRVFQAHIQIFMLGRDKTLNFYKYTGYFKK